MFVDVEEFDASILVPRRQAIELELQTGKDDFLANDRAI